MQPTEGRLKLYIGDRDGMTYGDLCVNKAESGGDDGANMSGIARVNENGCGNPSLTHTTQHLQCC